jgi:hypothetical protein
LRAARWGGNIALFGAISDMAHRTRQISDKAISDEGDAAHQDMGL